MAELEAALLLTTPINIADDAEVGTRDGVKLIDGAAVGLTVRSDVGLAVGVGVESGAGVGLTVGSDEGLAVAL